jgi:hypothetical protein
VSAFQANLPFTVGIYAQRGSGRTQWQYYAWRLPENEVQQIHAHAKLFAICQRDVIPLQLTREQDAELRELCRNPAVRTAPETVKFLMQSIVGLQPHRSNSKKQATIESLVSDPEATALVEDYIAAGYEMQNVRQLDGAGACHQDGRWAKSELHIRIRAACLPLFGTIHGP